MILRNSWAKASILVTVVILFSFFLLPSAKVAPPDRCSCLSQQVTAEVTGTSTVNCQGAKDDALNKALALTNCTEFPCDYWLEITQSCYCPSAGQFVVKGKLHYGCFICIE